MTTPNVPDIPVLVAGAGAAGTVAALRFAAHGVSSLLIDGSAVYPASANLGMAAGMIPAAGTRLQRAAAVDDSPALLAQDIQHKASEQAPAQIVDALAEISAPLVDWLVDDVGIGLELVTDFVYPGHSVPRCHAMPDRYGASLHRALIGAVTAEPGIDLVHPLRLAALAPVAGGSGGGFDCELVTPDGGRETVRAGVVVLCSGGFGAAADLVRTYVPAGRDLDYHGGEGSTGDALRLAEAIGLDLDYLDSFQGHGSLSFAGVPLTWAAMVHAGFLVNADGHRFGDESRGYSEYAALTAAQPGGTAWAIFDERAEAELARSHDFRVITDVGLVTTADDAAQLATRIGVDPVILTDELDSIADATARSTGDRFGREWARVPGPGLRAVKVRGALFHTQGGIAVDRHARALRGGTPVPGLYAAGGAAAGISGHGAAGYLAGNGLLSAMGLALLAADHMSLTSGREA